MVIDTRYIKFSGKAEIERDLVVGNNYTIVSNGTVTSETLSDLQNGAFAKSYKWEVIQTEITNDKGESIKAKDTRSNSTLMRNQHYAIYQNLSTDMDFDTFHTEMVREHMKMSDVIANKITNKNK
jgi:hypothetical protein